MMKGIWTGPEMFVPAVGRQLKQGDEVEDMPDSIANDFKKKGWFDMESKSTKLRKEHQTGGKK